MWFILATLASAGWGIEYILSEKLYKQVSVVTSLAISYSICAVLYIVLAFASGHAKKDLITLSISRPALLMMGGATLALLAAELFIGFSIQGKNATIAGLIEISYPLFIALFGYLFFRESNLNPGTVAGAIMIFCGVTAIYFFNR